MAISARQVPPLVPALVEGLRRPNPDIVSDRPRPLLERSPVGFWRTIAIAALLLNSTALTPPQ